MTTTESPIKDISVKDKIELVRKQFGDEAANKVAQQELNKKVIDKKEILLPEEIVNKTDHLPKYDLVKQVIALQGDEYTMITKEIYKMLVSFAIADCNRIIKVGEIETCMRVHPTSIISSGKGKKNICEAVKKIARTYKPDVNIKEPRTIHYQHLIGKMLLRKEKIEDGETSTGKIKYKTVDRWIPKYGYLFSDILILEEAHELFNSMEKNDVDCRDAITVALDPYKKNLIMKQNMDNLDTKEETLSGYPYVFVLPFAQPIPFNETFVTKGLGRRLDICYKEFPERTKLDKYIKRLTSINNEEESCNEFAKYMKKINSVKTPWKLSSDAVETFVICHAALLEQGFRLGGKIAHYTRILEFPMQNILLKMSAIQAISNLRTEISKQDVELAYIDVIERLTHEFKFVDKKVKGTLDYGESWGGAIGKTQECLEELYNAGATSKETSINIYILQKMIGRIFDISDRRARDRYNEMKQQGLICDFRGQGKDNGVWLNFEPKIATQEEKETDEKINPRKLYLEILDRTEKSDRTPKTDKQLIIKTDISSSIYNSNDKPIRADIVQTENNIMQDSSNVNNTSYGVQSVQSVQSNEEKSERDTQYYESKECESIQQTGTKEEVQDYIKQHPEAKTEQLIEQFGPSVLRFKKEGLF